MTLPQNILVIYDRGTKNLLRYVIPDSEEEINDPKANFYNPLLNEVAVKHPLSLYKSYGPGPHPSIQNWVYANT